MKNIFDVCLIRGIFLNTHDRVICNTFILIDFNFSTNHNQIIPIKYLCNVALLFSRKVYIYIYTLVGKHTFTYILLVLLNAYFDIF